MIKVYDRSVKIMGEVKADKYMQNVLVTGVNGLVGYAVVEKLIQNKDINLWGIYHKNVPEIMDNRIQMDLSKQCLTDIGVHFDCVIHCAALIPTRTADINNVAATNRRIDDNIIEYVKRNNSLLVYMSSTAVYGNIVDKVNEGSPIDIKNLYANEKWKTEEKIMSRCKKYYIFRLSSPYGVRMKQENVLKLFICNALKGENIQYFGSGERTQNFTHVNDISAICEKCMTYDQYGIYNVASLADISMKNLGKLIANEIKNLYGHVIEVVPANAIDEQENIRNMIDISKAIEIIRWKPTIMLEKGVQELIYAWGFNQGISCKER